MAITYKTVLTGVIKGFNNIQETLRTKFEGSSRFSDFKEIKAENGKITNTKTPDAMVNEINNIVMVPNATFSITPTEVIDGENRTLTLTFSKDIPEAYYYGSSSIIANHTLQLAKDSDVIALALRHIDSVLDVNSFAGSDEVAAIAAR